MSVQVGFSERLLGNLGYRTVVCIERHAAVEASAGDDGGIGVGLVVRLIVVGLQHETHMKRMCLKVRESKRRGEGGGNRTERAKRLRKV